MFYLANIVGSALNVVACTEGILSNFGPGGIILQVFFNDCSEMKLYRPYSDFTRRILVGSSVLNNDQHIEFAAVFNWSRNVWEGLLADSHLR